MSDNAPNPYAPPKVNLDDPTDSKESEEDYGSDFFMPIYIFGGVLVVIVVVIAFFTLL